MQDRLTSSTINLWKQSAVFVCYSTSDRVKQINLTQRSEPIPLENRGWGSQTIGRPPVKDWYSAASLMGMV